MGTAWPPPCLFACLLQEATHASVCYPHTGAAFQKTVKSASAVAGVKGKLSAFESKSKEAEPARTKTWRVGAGQGQFKAKTVIGGGPAPKKGFADLP